MKNRVRIVAAVLVGGTALGFAATPVSAAGYGAQINDRCDTSYGQLVSAGKKAAREDAHPAFTPSGARGFVENTASFDLHCPE